MSQYGLATLLRNYRVPPADVPIPSVPGLRAVQSMVERTWSTLCEIMREIRADDGFGGSSVQWTHSGRYPCNVQRAQAAAESSGGGGATENETVFEVSMPPYADVRNSDRLAIPGFLNDWVASAVYAEGNKVIPSTMESGSGAYFECVDGGTAGATEPTWPIQPDGTVIDGGVMWKLAGVVTYHEVIGSDPAQSGPAQLVVRTKAWV